MRDSRYFSGGNDKYELNIISHHPKFDGKVLSKYFVDNIDTIGVWGEEAFEIQVKNHSHERVQVKISLDGTDILTGGRASVQPHGKMWLIEPYDTLSLSAWPEDTEKGARFVFGKTGNSVAANTHGDLSNKGIVSAAFFTEGYVEPRRYYPSGFLGGSRVGSDSRDFSRRSPIRAKMDMSKSSKSLDYVELNCCDADVAVAGAMREIMDGPAVGAGETIRQKIGSVQGFRQPRFDRIATLRYLWWDDLKVKLERSETTHPTGFADAPLPQKLANLGRTPRIERAHSA